MENLYLLTTNGLGDYYVLANDPTEAQKALIKILDDQNYGLYNDRRVINIKWITESFGKSLNDETKPFLSDKSKRLLIVKHWV